MAQRTLAIATVLGGLLVAGGLVYHGRQLAEVSRQIEAMERGTTNLDHRLEGFSAELPVVVGEAGYEAGRQAVRGLVGEVVQMPARWMGAGSAPAAGGEEPGGSAAGAIPGGSGGVPLVRFDIQNPVITIEIFPGLTELTELPWLPEVVGQGTTPEGELAGGQPVSEEVEDAEE